MTFGLWNSNIFLNIKTLFVDFVMFQLTWWCFVCWPGDVFACWPGDGFSVDLVMFCLSTLWCFVCWPVDVRGVLLWRRSLVVVIIYVFWGIRTRCTERSLKYVKTKFWTKFRVLRHTPFINQEKNTKDYSVNRYPPIS